MSDPKENPIFKAIEMKCIQESDLNVSFRFDLKCIIIILICFKLQIFVWHTCILHIVPSW